MVQNRNIVGFSTLVISYLIIILFPIVFMKEHALNVNAICKNYILKKIFSLKPAKSAALKLISLEIYYHVCNRTFI